MSRRKWKVLVVIAAAAICCFGAGAISAYAYEGEVIIVSNTAFYETHFENETGNPWDSCWWGNAAVSWETENPINGTRSVKSEGTGSAGGLLMLTLNTDKVVPELNKTYKFEFKLKAENFTSLAIISNYGDYAEARFDGKEWAKPEAFVDMSVKEENGVYNISYEKVIGSIGYGGNYNLFSIFAYEGEGKIVLDDFSMSDVSGKENAYFTTQYDSDFESESEGNIWDITPFWGNANVTLEWETEEPLSGTRSLSYQASGIDNYQIGGITWSKLTTKPDKLYYYDFKINIEGLSKVVIVTLDNEGIDNGANSYTEIIYNNGSWSASGIDNFKSEDTGTYYHLTYYRTTSSVGKDDFKFYATGTGKIVLDDFLCAYEDNAPSADRRQAKFNVYSPADVSFVLELKEEKFLSVKHGAETLSEDDYTFTENTLTLKKEFFSDKTEDVIITVESAAGTLDVTVTIVAEKKQVKISGVIAENKVYDGTTAAQLNLENLVLDGVDIEDDVQLSVSAAVFDNAVAGKDKTVTVTGLSLTGIDAVKYELSVNELSLEAEITQKPLEIGEDALSVQNKTYDGTTVTKVLVDVEKIEGIIEGDTISVSADAAFLDKNAADNKTVTVNSFALSGEDMANYTIVTESVQKKADIEKRKITVTADNITVKKGEDKELTYQVEGLIAGDTLKGALSREEGENAGNYAISIGTLSNPNYEIQFIGGTYTIEKSGCACNSYVSWESVAAGVLLATAVALFAIKRRFSSR